MSKQVRETVRVTATPDQVWAIVGDPGSVHEWVPAIDASRLDGDLRHADFAGGAGSAVERIVAHDDARRSYTYRYLEGPLALEQYESTIIVVPSGTGAEVLWEADFVAASEAEEVALHEAISGIYAAALAELARRVS